MKNETGIILPLILSAALVSVAASKPVEGFADEQGNFVSDNADIAKAPARKSDWGTTPLGAPGKLVADTTLKKKAEFLPPPVRAPGPVLIDGGRTVSIVAPTDAERPLAEEIAWHLKEMSGKDVPVVAAPPASGPREECRRAARGSPRPRPPAGPA